MLIEAKDIEPGASLDADVCIVGAGAAGISIARKLVGRKQTVCLLESGGLEADSDTQALYRGVEKGLAKADYLLSSRLRFFGGTTNHWNGWCRPLDPIDFEQRAWVPHSGWPLTRKDLDPYYSRASDLCEIGPFGESSGPMARLLERRLEDPEDPDIATRIIQVSPPTRFGQVYRSELAAAENARVVLGANVTGLRLAASGHAVEHADVASLNGRRFSVGARVFVIAAGGIENARLLLASNDVRPAGIGNEHDLVGRFFMEHPHVVPAAVILRWEHRHADLYGGDAITPGIDRSIALWTLRPDRQRELRLRNACFQPIPNTGRPQGQVFSDLLTALEGPPHGESPGTSGWAHGLLWVRVEQAPNPASRVTLASERDPLGGPRAALDWRVTDEDRQSTAQSVAILRRALGRLGRGRVRMQPERSGEWQIIGGNHHMGTTRMHEDPRRGVANPDARVHSVENLYLAGSSLFPTSGCFNPTLTIVALALRLADHLQARFRS